MNPLSLNNLGILKSSLGNFASKIVHTLSDLKISAIALLIFSAIGFFFYQLINRKDEPLPIPDRRKPDSSGSRKEGTAEPSQTKPYQDVQEISSQPPAPKDQTKSRPYMQKIPTAPPLGEEILEISPSNTSQGELEIPSEPPAPKSQTKPRPYMQKIPPAPTPTMEGILRPSQPANNQQQETAPPQSIPRVNRQSVQEIPSAPLLDFEAHFSELAVQTKNVSCFPYSGNCRFQDILCPKKTHVKVAGGSEEMYLHANHVDLAGNRFTATQYPLQSQHNLFWRASRASLVIDLTNRKDSGIEPYYPGLNETMAGSDITVQCVKKEKVKGMNAYIASYQVNDSSTVNPSFRTVRLHYQGWDDHQGIGENDLDKLISIIEQHQQGDSPPSLIVHCRAGVGRTGTVIVADALKRLIDRKEVNRENLLPVLKGLILQGREQRGINFVQSPKQFMTLWKWSWRALHRSIK